LGPFVQIAASRSGHTCALTPAGAADCWGYNFYGQAQDQPGPYTQVSGGWFHTCALTPADAADCWGDNGAGQATDQVGPYRSSVPTQLSIKVRARVAEGSKVTIKGTLSSLDDTCGNVQAVTLEKGSATIGPKETGPLGTYRFRTRITARTSVRVRFAGTPPCDPSNSAKRTVRVI
jgi:hypothetical protein